MKRIRIRSVEPESYRGMLALEEYLRVSPLSRKHFEIIKIRASQINGCSFCIGMHTHDARAIGETEQRIYALDAWQESPLFDETERAILDLTESITFVATSRVPDDVYARAAALLDEHYLAAVIMAIVTINAWNRIAIATRMVWEEPK